MATPFVGKLDGKSVLVGAVLALVVLKFVVPRVPQLQGLASKVS
jgi:hypothetical protein